MRRVYAAMMKSQRQLQCSNQPGCVMMVATMEDNEDVSKKLRREAEQLRETAVALMEHATQLISKSLELDKQIERNAKSTQGRKK
jgi:hypothetical protein